MDYASGAPLDFSVLNSSSSGQSGSAMDSGDILGSLERGGVDALGFGAGLADILTRYRTSNSSPLANPPGGFRPGATPNRAAYAQQVGTFGGVQGVGSMLFVGVALIAVVLGVVILAKKA